MSSDMSLTAGKRAANSRASRLTLAAITRLIATALFENTA